MHAGALRYFMSVARAGSIRRASEELFVAASAISRQIQKLEDDLGVPLFDRLPNGLRLTTAGRIVLDYADATTRDFEILKGELGELRGLRTGSISIATLDSLMVGFLPTIVAAFHARNPNVDFAVRSTNPNTIATMVAEGEADVGISFNLPLPEDLDFIADIPMPLMAMVGRSHPLARHESLTFAECIGHGLLLQLDTAPIRSLIEVELSALERAGKVVMKSNNLLMLKPMIAAGLGVAFYTPIGMAAEIAEGSIVAVPLTGTRLDALRLGLVVPRRRRMTAAVEEMVADLTAGLAALEEAQIAPGRPA